MPSCRPISRRQCTGMRPKLNFKPIGSMIFSGGTKCVVLVRVAAYAVDVQQKLNLQKMLQTRVLRTGFPAISALKRIQVLVNHTSSQRDAGMSQRYVSLCLLAIVAALSPPKASVPPVAPRHASAQRRETGRSDGQTCLTLPRRSAFGLTAACAAFAARPAAAAESLREALAARLARDTSLLLTAVEQARVTRRHVRAAAFVDATYGAPACAEISPLPPPPTPADLFPSPSPPPSPPPSALDEIAVVDVTVELFDSFSDGWGSLRLVVRARTALA